MTRPALLDQGERTDEGRGSLPSPSLLHLPAPPPIFRPKISPKKRREKVFLSQTWVKPHFTVSDAVGIDGLRLIGEHGHPYFAMMCGGAALGIGHFKDAAPGRKDIGICYGLAIIGIDHTELGRNRGQVQEKSTAQKEKRSNTIHRKVCNKLIRQLNSPGFNEGPSILQTGRERFLFKPWREIQG